ncbi:MAG: helix-turn-helix domain-containing protein [Mesorhizobium sp.]|uniref:transcriptional regulator n=1 Tax=Mesorhizobium sp. TaxID=1871066 RepID=UPI00122B73D1|nr:transcriptional regulator [Mesorhizobium sp.]TIQ46383.1 MAG: helix-turn-helix domain-containing protein [Mesorhizobium sp.]
MKEITGAQIRAARALVRWSAEDLAVAASVGVATVRRAEAEDGVPPTTVANRKAIRGALETAGIEFIPENGRGPGVRLVKRISGASATHGTGP